MVYNILILRLCICDNGARDNYAQNSATGKLLEANLTHAADGLPHLWEGQQTTLRQQNNRGVDFSQQGER